MEYKSSSAVNPNGWYRVLQMNRDATYSQCFFLYVSNSNGNSANVNLLFLIGMGYGDADVSTANRCKPFIQQIGKGNLCGSNVKNFVKKIRIVKESSNYYLDIQYGSISGTGNRIQYCIKPLCVENIPIFSVGNSIGESLTELDSLTVEYLT